MVHAEGDELEVVFLVCVVHVMCVRCGMFMGCVGWHVVTNIQIDTVLQSTEKNPKSS